MTAAIPFFPSFAAVIDRRDIHGMRVLQKSQLDLSRKASRAATTKGVVTQLLQLRSLKRLRCFGRISALCLI
jgi:hypothetical protein